MMQNFQTKIDPKWQLNNRETSLFKWTSQMPKWIIVRRKKISTFKFLIMIMKIDAHFNIFWYFVKTETWQHSFFNNPSCMSCGRWPCEWHWSYFNLYRSCMYRSYTKVDLYSLVRIGRCRNQSIPDCKGRVDKSCNKSSYLCISRSIALIRNIWG